MNTHYTRFSLAIICMLAGILFASPLFWQAASARAMPAGNVAAPALNTNAEMNSPAGIIWTKCTPVNVAVFATRVHVKCSEAVGGIQYFAAPTANNSHAARVLSILTAAHATGTTIDIQYDPADESGAAFGCQAGDCRTIHGVAYLK